MGHFGFGVELDTAQGEGLVGLGVELDTGLGLGLADGIGEGLGD